MMLLKYILVVGLWKSCGSEILWVIKFFSSSVLTFPQLGWLFLQVLWPRAPIHAAIQEGEQPWPKFIWHGGNGLMTGLHLGGHFNLYDSMICKDQRQTWLALNGDTWNQNEFARQKAHGLTCGSNSAMEPRVLQAPGSLCGCGNLSPCSGVVWERVTKGLDCRLATRRLQVGAGLHLLRTDSVG